MHKVGCSNKNRMEQCIYHMLSFSNISLKFNNVQTTNYRALWQWSLLFANASVKGFLVQRLKKS